MSSAQTNNNTLEKYCYNDLAINCDTYGDLYQWSEMVQYTVLEPTQSVCPVGWHVPSDDEYKTLEMYLGMTITEAEALGFRGTDEGSKIGENSALWSDGNLDQIVNFGSSGYIALPAGV
ncbi:MAG: hypothetical protein ACI86M_000274 [Saprospiraceae bacterium]